jgi:hypothetical protein
MSLFKNACDNIKMVGLIKLGNKIFSYIYHKEFQRLKNFQKNNSFQMKCIIKKNPSNIKVKNETGRPQKLQ